MERDSNFWCSVKRRRSKIGGQFMWRLIEMLESPAYRVLSLSGRRVLDRLDIEFAHHGGTDNGRLPVTYDDFERYGIDRHAIAPAIREVAALGFAEVTERGRAGNSEFRTPSRYRITYRETDHADPTDDWRNVKTDQQAEATSVARKASEKEKASGDKSRFSVRKTHTDKAATPVGKIPTTASVGKTPTTSISRGGGRDAA